MDEADKAPITEVSTSTDVILEPNLAGEPTGSCAEVREDATIADCVDEVTACAPQVPRSEPDFCDERAPVEPGRDAFALEAIKDLGERLTRRLDSLQTILEREMRAEAARERVVDRLHAELQEYKHDLLLRVQRPIFIDLIQLHDDLGKMIEARPAETEPERHGVVAGVLDSIRTAIEDILYRQGVEPFAVEGDGFDPRRQRAVSTTATDDPARNKSIAARLRKGFQAGDKLIRPEIVSVFTTRQVKAASPADVPRVPPAEPEQSVSGA
jgi:molecular chaperone GrpE